MEAVKDRIDLVAVMHAAVANSQSLLAAAGMEMTIVVPREPLHVAAAQEPFTRVLTTLLQSAARLSPRGSRLLFSAARERAEVLLRIGPTDLQSVGEGPSRLADRFSPATHHDADLAFALSMLRDLLATHGGTLEAQQAPAGPAQTLSVRFPAVEATARGSGDAERPKASKGCRVLVVDDNRDSADSLRMLLKLMGSEVRLAYDGLEALQVASDFRPHVVLLDLSLPKLNGCETAVRIRQETWGRDLFLVALTGWAKEDDRRRTKAAGFDLHLVKPVDPTVLEKLVTESQPASV